MKQVVRGTHRLLTGKDVVKFLIIPVIFGLAACSVSAIAVRPSDAKLRSDISTLISEFAKRHPQMVSWNAEAVNAQLARPLPVGRATEAGWTIEWSGATKQELSKVVIPWRLVGPVPKSYGLDAKNYTGGNPAPKSAVSQIKAAKEAVDPWFAAIVHIRLSKTDPTWAIFTAVPYLPVTDIAYGWAKNENGHWQVHDFGTAQIGCGVTPLPVLNEFGFGCPST